MSLTADVGVDSDQLEDPDGTCLGQTSFKRQAKGTGMLYHPANPWGRCSGGRVRKGGVKGDRDWCIVEDQGRSDEEEKREVREDVRERRGQWSVEDSGWWKRGKSF